MLKIFIKLIKKVCFAFVMLYGLNLLLSSTNINIPINYISIPIVTFLGIPGICSLIIVYLII